MATKVLGLILESLTADPGAPEEGEVWHRSDLNEVYAYLNGTIEQVIYQSDLAAHIAAANPHGVTLEQARTANNTLAGVIDMGNNKIINLADPTLANDAATFQWTLDQINQRLQGLDWQESVLDKDLTAPPGSPTTGDRYIAAAVATGAWAGQEDSIAEWDGTAWVFSPPDNGFCTKVEDEGIVYIYDGSTWGQFGSAVDHGSLLGLNDDDHVQYLLVSGARAMAGNLDMGANDIVNVGLVDGVDVSAHASRHQPGGADPLPTATAVEITDSTNAEGTSTSFARADHQHAHGNRGGGTLHAETSASGAGFYPQSNLGAITDPGVGDDSADGYKVGSRWVNTVSDEEFVCLDASVGAAVWKSTTDAGASFLVHKAGFVLNAGFAGNPKKATVTFSSAFPDANYAVVVSGVTTGGKSFVYSIESQLATGFTIAVSANNITGLTQVNWTAIYQGEST